MHSRKINVSLRLVVKYVAIFGYLVVKLNMRQPENGDACDNWALAERKAPKRLTDRQPQTNSFGVPLPLDKRFDFSSSRPLWSVPLSVRSERQTDGSSSL